MAKLKSTFGLHAGKLAHLFGLGAGQDPDGEGPDHTPNEAELLRERLGERLPNGLWSLGQLSREWERFDRTVNSVLGLPLRELLIQPDTDPALLGQVKDYAARLSTSAQSRGHKQVANVIYYAAIASALLHHDHILTEFSHSELHRAYSTLAEVQWVTPELAHLFAAAASVCAAKEDASNKEARPND
jgi:hypothetical protein